MLSLLRIEYLPTVLLPSIIGIYFSKRQLLVLLPSLIGWCFLAIGQNLLNDFFDQDRKLVLGRRGLLLLSIAITILSFPLFSFELILYPVLFFIIDVLYNWKLKKIGIINITLQVLAYSILPYLYYSSSINWVILSFFVIGGFGGELMHECIDEEATYRLLKEKTIYLSRILVLIAILLLGYITFSYDEYLMFLPLLLIFILGEIGLFIDPKNKNIRILGTYTGCFMIVYFMMIFVKLGMV